jgi:repressor LexA
MSEPKKAPLTDRQREIYDFISSFVDDWGYGPSTYEIADAFGFSGPAAAICHLNALEKKGWLVRTRKVSRSIVLT